MNSKILWRVSLWLGVFFILCSLLITVVEYTRFNQGVAIFPSGSQIAGVPVGGLGQDAAEERLAEFYSLPLVLVFDNAIIHAEMDELGFTVDVNALIEAGVEQVSRGSFWAHLWQLEQSLPAVDIPLLADVNERLVLDYLDQEIVPRYTQPGSPVIPIVWTTNFIPESSGEALAVQTALGDIRSALLTPDVHQVVLQTEQGADAGQAWDVLEAFLRHNINYVGFDDLVEVYLESLETGQVLQFAVWGDRLVEPGIAFPAASTNKIPIMISALRRVPDPVPEQVVTLLTQMIARSENPPADTLMAAYLDEVRGPLVVSEDMAELGLENTFLGMYYLDPTPLILYETPANTRQDVFLAPDPFNQTIPAEAGLLLAAIYQCAEDGQGLLIETFPGEINLEKCQLMVDTLAANRIGLLIEAGVPAEATVAHKHGWAPDTDGQLRFMSDVGMVFSPGGDYVLNVFVYDSERLDFDQGNRLVARLSQTVYNFFNLGNQAHWWFD